MPVDARVADEHRVLELGRADEPRSARVIQKRRLAPPAMWVRVLVQRRLPEHTAAFQLFENDCIGVLDEHPADERHVFWKFAAEIDGLQKSQHITLTCRIVVRAERGRHVNDPGSFIGGDEGLADDYLVLAL